LCYTQSFDHVCERGALATAGSSDDKHLAMERLVLGGEEGAGALAGQEHAVDPLRSEKDRIGIAHLVDANPDVLFDSPIALSKAMSGQLPENLLFVNRAMYVVEEQVGEMVADGS